MNDEHMQMIEDCEGREQRLDDWARGFIDSIKRQMESGRALSQKQADTLEAIWERATARG
jgi:hypothetical protein